MLLEFLLSAFVFTAVFWAGILGLDREGVPRSPPPSIPESILHSTSPLLSLFCLHLRSPPPPSRKRTSYSPSHLWELSLQTLSLSTLCPAHPKAQGAGWNPTHSRGCLRTLLWEELPLATYSTITMQLCAFPPLQSELHPPSSYVEVPTPSTSEFNSI